MFIPLSRPCIGGILATPDVYGTFVWVIEGTHWQYAERRNRVVEVNRDGRWQAVTQVPTLNQAVAVSIGWQARGVADGQQAVTQLEDAGPGRSQQP